MLDAHTAPDPSARVPVPQTLPAVPAAPRSQPSANEALFTAAGTLLPVLDWTALGGREEGAWVWKDDVIPVLGDFRQGAEIPRSTGILFTTYATLRSPSRQGRASRHHEPPSTRSSAGSPEDPTRTTAMLSTAPPVSFSTRPMRWPTRLREPRAKSLRRGDVKPSAQGRAGLRLQNAGLPDARIRSNGRRPPYVSATGATTVGGPGPGPSGLCSTWETVQRCGDDGRDDITLTEDGETLSAPSRPGLGRRRDAVREPERFRVGDGSGRRRRHGSGGEGSEGPRLVPGARIWPMTASRWTSWCMRSRTSSGASTIPMPARSRSSMPTSKRRWRPRASCRGIRPSTRTRSRPRSALSRAPNSASSAIC